MSLFSKNIAISLVDDAFIFSSLSRENPLIIPAYVAVQTGTNQILACGEEAQAMQNKEPPNITVINVLAEGGLADSETASALFRFGIQQLTRGRLLIRPKVIIAVRSYNPAKYAVKDMAISGGARDVYLLEMGMATAIGMQLNVQDPQMKAVLSISNDWFEFSIISLAGVLSSASGPIGINDFVEDIQNHFVLTEKFKPEFETLKSTFINQGLSSLSETTVSGWDVWSGKTEYGQIRSSSIDNERMRMGMLPSFIRLTERVKASIRKLPQDKQFQLSNIKIHGAGMAMNIPHLPELLSQQLGHRISTFNSPYHPSIDGAEQVLSELKFLKMMKNK